MNMLKARSLYPISVDSVIFAFIGGELKVALMQRKTEPFVGMWAIPGGFMEGDETVEQTALRELKEETGIEHIYIEQFGVFSERGRDPRGPTITVAFFALIHAELCNLTASGDASDARWWSVDKIPKLAFDHHIIYNKALEALRRAAQYKPLVFELLPREFTLSELQNLYQQLYGSTLEKRNFRKKVQKMSFIVATGKSAKGARHRPAELFRYNPKLYAKFEKDMLF
jgi:8-oxo-dGTP diphosphatase